MATPPQLRILFTVDAIDDLRRLGPSVVPQVLKKLSLLETDPRVGYPLGSDLTGFRKLVVGNNSWRIVYRVVAEDIEICEIWAVGQRHDGAVYRAAAARVATSSNPDLAPMADVVSRIGKLAGIATEPEVRREPVPDWLARRLTGTAGLSHEVVAAMDAEQALDAWTRYCTSGQIE